MGSRYDISVFKGATLEQFRQAVPDPAAIGEAVPGPWQGPSATTVAQIDTDFGSNVVLVAEPMKTPRGVDSLLAHKLGVEGLFATVWDSVSTYSLTVVADGIDRQLSFEPQDWEDEDEADPADGVEQSGARLPEEPGWPELDEAYIQVVFTKRCGIDPGRLGDGDGTWFAIDPDRLRPPRA